MIISIGNNLIRKSISERFSDLVYGLLRVNKSAQLSNMQVWYWYRNDARSNVKAGAGLGNIVYQYRCSVDHDV
jgi:hypothetical protein